jgi:predicted RNA-binding Zn-ribbon protein involved in translation (DUF1610 family)
VLNSEGKVRWSPRVDPEKIRRLYECEARGLLDEDLLEDVFITIYLRCQSILTCTEAAEGRVKCPQCGFVIQRQNGRRNDRRSKAELLQCGDCSWQSTWGTFFKSYQGKQLFAGGAAPAIAVFLRGFDTARTPRDKLLLIDALIHAYHGEAQQNPIRPVAINLIATDYKTVFALLEGLAYGDDAPEMHATKAAWDENARISDERIWRGRLRNSST